MIEKFKFLGDIIKSYNFQIGFFSGLGGGSLVSFLWIILFRKNLQNLPSLLLWTPLKKPSLPIIDLNENAEIISEKIKNACLDSGFFYVKNHGISKKLRELVFENSKKFFASDITEKNKYLMEKGKWRGFEPSTKDRISPSQLANVPKSKHRTKESFYIGREISIESPESSDPSQALNIWPSAELFPDFRDVMTRYFVDCWHLSLKITSYISLSLGLSLDHFEKIKAFEHPMIQLRLLHYDSTFSNPKNDIYAARPHTDYGYLTLLLVDQIPGLQLFRNNCWIDVEYVEDAFIVNLGDMLQKFTAGLYKSSLHRVVNNSGKDRYSVPFFFEPNVNFIVKPIQEAINYQLKHNIPISDENLKEVTSSDRLKLETKTNEQETEKILKTE